jgi:hypothetical protein
MPRLCSDDRYKILPTNTIQTELHSIIDVKNHTDRIESNLNLKHLQVAVYLFPNYYLFKKRKVHIRIYVKRNISYYPVYNGDVKDEKYILLNPRRNNWFLLFIRNVSPTIFSKKSISDFLPSFISDTDPAFL